MTGRSEQIEAESPGCSHSIVENVIKEYIQDGRFSKRPKWQHIWREIKNTNRK